MEILKLLSSSEIVAQIVNFLLVLFLLRMFVWRKVLSILDARRDKIVSDMKMIEETKLEVSHLKAKYDALLQAIEETAKARMREAVSLGEKSAQEIREKGRGDAERLIEEAKKEIRYELSRSRQELKDKIVELTIQATESVIQEKLTPENDRRLIEEFLKDVDTLGDPPREV